MKNSIFTIVLLFAITCTHAQITTPAASPSASLTQTVGLTEISIDYSRPGKKGRAIFGDLVPYGSIWRTGANSTTKVTIDKPITINNKELPKGTYSLYTIPGESLWEVIFYTDHSTPMLKEIDDEKVALRTMVESKPISMDFESFTIMINNVTADGAELAVMWDKTYVSIPFTVATDKDVMGSIETVMAGPSSFDYYNAAVYYLNTGKDIEQAKNWINKSLSMSDNPGYWQLRQQSLILAKSGDKKGAIEAAKKSLEAAEKAGNMDYVKMNQQALEQWGVK